MVRRFFRIFRQVGKKRKGRSKYYRQDVQDEMLDTETEETKIKL